jgi:hypothetical protein
MIIIRNSQLGQDTIKSLNLLLDLNLPTKTAFSLVRIMKEISSIIDDKIKLEKKILDKYVERDIEGNPVLGKDENGNSIPNTFRINEIDSFNSEMEELNSIETELPFEQLKIEELDLPSIKVRDLMKLEFLFNL